MLTYSNRLFSKNFRLFSATSAAQCREIHIVQRLKMRSPPSGGPLVSEKRDPEHPPSQFSAFSKEFHILLLRRHLCFHHLHLFLPLLPLLLLVPLRHLVLNVHLFVFPLRLMGSETKRLTVLDPWKTDYVFSSSVFAYFLEKFISQIGQNQLM